VGANKNNVGVRRRVSTTRDDVINLEFLIFTYWNLETLLVNRSTYPSQPSQE
jgi:hypothetical protein